MSTFTEMRNVTFTVVSCADCAVDFAVTERLRAARLESGAKFWCPNGHVNVYRESDSDRLRKQLETEQRKVIRLQAERNAAVNNREAAERSAAAFKGQATRLRKRVGNGVCPVKDCHRHFQNVEAHIKRKHPDFVDAEV
jgi:hypothetical protein